MTYKAIQLPEAGIYLYESQHKSGNFVHVHHHSVHQILYVLEGKGKIFIDGKEINIKQDHAAFIIPHTDHAIVSNSSLTILVLAFDIETIPIKKDHSFFQQSHMLYSDFLTGTELRQHLRRMLYEQSINNEFASWALQVHLQHILLLLARLQERSQIHDANGLRADKIKNYIDTHYFESLTAKDIATKLGFSERYIQRIFKERYEKTPMQYLMEVRIERAKKLLAETEKEIVKICFEVGYENLSTFYRAFKNLLHMSPKQYREKVQYLDSN